MWREVPAFRGKKKKDPYGREVSWDRRRSLGDQRRLLQTVCGKQDEACLSVRQPCAPQAELLASCCGGRLRAGKRALEHGPWEGPAVGCEKGAWRDRSKELRKCGSLQKKPGVPWKPGTIAEWNAMGGHLPHPLASSASLGSRMASDRGDLSDPPARTSSALVGPGVLAAANFKASLGISPGLPCLRWESSVRSGAVRSSLELRGQILGEDRCWLWGWGREDGIRGLYGRECSWGNTVCLGQEAPLWRWGCPHTSARSGSYQSDPAPGCCNRLLLCTPGVAALSFSGLVRCAPASHCFPSLSLWQGTDTWGWHQSQTWAPGLTQRRKRNGNLSM